MMNIYFLALQILKRKLEMNILKEKNGQGRNDLIVYLR